ncbi:MAG: hypothetical protein Q7J29_08065 [Stagnimonas sp.]|nr:hypothetical protein [Stagnimonas sp.]
MARFALHALRAVLLLLLLVQGLQLASALMLFTSDASAISPQLWPALLLKAALVATNAVLCWLCHRALRRKG